MSKIFFPKKKTLKNDFENRSAVPTIFQGSWPVGKLRDAPSVHLSRRVRRRCALFISCPDDLLCKTLVVGTSAEKCAPSADASGQVQTKRVPWFFRRVMTLGQSSGPRNDFQSHFSKIRGSGLLKIMVNRSIVNSLGRGHWLAFHFHFQRCPHLQSRSASVRTGPWNQKWLNVGLILCAFSFVNGLQFTAQNFLLVTRP